MISVDSVSIVAAFQMLIKRNLAYISLYQERPYGSYFLNEDGLFFISSGAQAPVGRRPPVASENPPSFISLGKDCHVIQRSPRLKRFYSEYFNEIVPLALTKSNLPSSLFAPSFPNIPNFIQRPPFQCATSMPPFSFPKKGNVSD